MSTPSSNDARNYLNAEVELQGTLRFSGELTFDGKLEGEIQSDGMLHLGEHAVVKGNLTVQNAVLRGKINGTVIAREKLDIKSNAEMLGTVRTARLVIEEGATFVGQSDVNPGKATPTAPFPARPGA